MNTPSPSPLIPQGSFQQSRGKTNVRIAVLTILAIHAVLLGGLLIQGCKRDTKTNDLAAVTNNTDVGFTPLTNSVTETPVAPAPLPIATPTNPQSLVTAPAPTPTPSTPTPEVPVAPSNTREYVVAKGDILANIAKKNGVTLKEIEAANPGLVPTKLKIGQKIQIPASSSVAAAPGNTTSPAPETAAGDTVTYVVRANDSLTKIAKSHGTTATTLKKLNNLKTDRITVGQKLKVPAGKPMMESAAAAPITSTNYVTPLPPASSRR